MSFFLLGKGPDDDLRLLSPKVLDSKQEALAELSRLTADPEFGHWDADVLLMELDKGTPVLLVRPAESSVPVDDEVDVEPPSEIPVKQPVEVDIEESIAEEFLEPMAPEPQIEASDEHEADPALAELIEGLHTDVTPEPEIAPESDTALEPEFNPEPEIAAEPDITPDPEFAAKPDESQEATSLRDALQRTAAHMESEGIVAPESIGPAPESQPDLESSVTAAAWPWDTTAEEGGFSLDALEEPARDISPIVTASGDDETVSASRPVILGTYGEATVHQVPEPVAVPDEKPAEAPDTSDFIMDLEPVDLPQEDPTQPSETSFGQTDMSCDDCVYVRTCPNKDQRDPKTCGSFQWK